MSNLDNPSTFAVTVATPDWNWWDSFLTYQYMSTQVAVGLAYQLDRTTVSPTVDKWPQSSWFENDSQDYARVVNFIFAGLDYGPTWDYSKCSQQTKVYRCYHIMRVDSWLSPDLARGWEAWVFAPMHVMGNVEYAPGSGYRHNLTAKALRQNWFVSIRTHCFYTVRPDVVLLKNRKMGGKCAGNDPHTWAYGWDISPAQETYPLSEPRTVSWHNHLLTSGDIFDNVPQALEPNLFNYVFDNEQPMPALWFPEIQKLRDADILSDKRFLASHPVDTSETKLQPTYVDVPFPTPPITTFSGIWSMDLINAGWWTYDSESTLQHAKNHWKFNGTNEVDIDAQILMAHEEYVPGFETPVDSDQFLDLDEESRSKCKDANLKKM